MVVIRADIFIEGDVYSIATEAPSPVTAMSQVLKARRRLIKELKKAEKCARSQIFGKELKKEGN